MRSAELRQARTGERAAGLFGELDAESRAFAWAALHADAAADAAEQVAHDREAEAGAAAGAAVRGVAAEEALEDLGKNCGIDARAGVAHGQGGAAALLAHADADLALRGVVDRVGD